MSRAPHYKTSLSCTSMYSTWFFFLEFLISHVIQIKICAEYRDMLPRPRLVCQEPGLRPIGRSPGVSDKSSRGLGSISRYSAQILICFIAHIFQFFVYSSVGLVGNFAGLPVCTVPSAIVHCNQNEAGHRTIKAPSMPCWGAAGPSKHSLVFMPQTGEIDRYMDEICINGKFSVQEPSEWRVFCIAVSNFTVFQPGIWTDSSSVGIRSNQVALKIN